MTIYLCDRCGYNTKKLCNYQNHINKQKVCHGNKNHIDIKYMHEKYNLTINHDKISPVWIDYLITNDIESVNKKNIIQCRYCCKVYTRKENLNKHLRLCINDANILIKELENKDLELRHQKLKMLEFNNNMKNILKNSISPPIQSITNINQNIVINNFGNEDFSFISNEQMKKYALNLPNGIQLFAERCHFSSKHPENKNVRIQDKNDGMIQVWDNSKWLYRNRYNILQIMVFNKYDILNKLLNHMENNQELSDIKLHLLECFRDKYIEDDEYFLNIIKNMEIIVINNSNI